MTSISYKDDLTILKQLSYKVETKNMDSFTNLSLEIDMVSNKKTGFQPTERNQECEIRKHIIRNFFNLYCSPECENENFDSVF